MQTDDQKMKEFNLGRKLSVFRNTFSSLKYPAFRLYYGVVLSQAVASNMRVMAQTLLIYRLTGSVTLLGVMALANALPGITLSLFGGVIADRIHKKYVFILGQAVSTITSLGVALALTTGYLGPERANSWWILIVAALIQGIIVNLALPSRHAIVAELVGTDQVMNAISLNNMGRSVIRLGAPAIAGLLIDAIGFTFVYYITSGIGFIALILTLFLPLTGTLEGRGASVISQLKDGLKYVRGKPNLLLILAFAMVMALLSMPYMRLMPIFVDDILKVGATGMGILLSVSTIGALVGSLVLASLSNKNRGRILLISAVVLGLSLTGFAFSHNWYLSLAFMVFVGIGQTARLTISNALLQYYSDPSYRGRVLSLYTMEGGVTSLGVFGAAMLAEVIGVPWTVGGFALTLVLLSLLALVFLPRIRKLD